MFLSTHSCSILHPSASKGLIPSPLVGIDQKQGNEKEITIPINHQQIYHPQVLRIEIERREACVMGIELDCASATQGDLNPR